MRKARVRRRHPNAKAGRQGKCGNAVRSVQCAPQCKQVQAGQFTPINRLGKNTGSHHTTTRGKVAGRQVQAGNSTPTVAGRQVRVARQAESPQNLEHRHNKIMVPQ